jgi:hypothetical protein
MLVWDLDKNFWEINSMFYLFFKELKDEDASKNKEVSSIKMWCISMMGADTSPLKNMTQEEKELILRDSFLKAHENVILPEKVSKNKDKASSKSEYVNVFKIFDKNLDAPLVERMVNITHSKAKKLLRMWENKLEERQYFINTTPYDKTSYEMLEKIIPPTAKMWQEYYRLKKESEEENEQSVHGGTEESFLEKEYGN